MPGSKLRRLKEMVWAIYVTGFLFNPAPRITVIMYRPCPTVASAARPKDLIIVPTLSAFVLVQEFLCHGVWLIRNARNVSTTADILLNLLLWLTRC
jgi:hypothetical protein